MRFEVKVSPCSVLPVGVFVGVTVPDEDFNWTHTFVTSLDDAVRIGESFIGTPSQEGLMRYINFFPINDFCVCHRVFSEMMVSCDSSY